MQTERGFKKEMILSLDISTTATGWAIFDGRNLVESGVIKLKDKDYFTRGLKMATEIFSLSKAAEIANQKSYEAVVIEKNSVMGKNQQSMIKIGIVTGMIIEALDILDIREFCFVNVSSWRKFWDFDYRDRSKKSMKKQAIAKVKHYYDKDVKDDEADAILIGAYYQSGKADKSKVEKYEI